VLPQALPYIHSGFEATVVVKFGGCAMVDEVLSAEFACVVRWTRLASSRWSCTVGPPDRGLADRSA
jgi:hypothetical protein